MLDTHCIIRTQNAGVFAGTLYTHDQTTRHATLHNARRLWTWAGAASLSELSQKGTAKPRECKFPAPVPEILLAEVIEIIPTSQVAQQSINSVPVWTAHLN